MIHNILTLLNRIAVTLQGIGITMLVAVALSFIYFVYNIIKDKKE